MVLLEFHYWTDVVMWVGVLNLIGISILVCRSFNKNTPTTDDPTGEIKKQIMDKLNSIITDIKSTIKN